MNPRASNAKKINMNECNTNRWKIQFISLYFFFIQTQFLCNLRRLENKNLQSVLFIFNVFENNVLLRILDPTKGDCFADELRCLHEVESRDFRPMNAI